MNAKRIAIIVVISIVVQVLFMSFCDIKIVKDAKRYDKMAVNISKGMGFTEDGIHPSRLYPGAPIVFGGIYAVFGHRPVMVKIFQAFLFCVFCVLIYDIGRLCFSDLIGFISAIACAIYPPLFVLPSILSNEFLFMATLAWAIQLYIYAQKKYSEPLFALIGILLAWIFFIRPNAIFVPLFLVVGAIFKIASRYAWLLLMISMLFIFIPILSGVIEPPHSLEYIPIIGKYIVKEGGTFKNKTREDEQQKIENFLVNQHNRQLKLVEEWYDKANIEISKNQMRERLKGPLGKIIPQDYSWHPKNIIDAIRRLYISSHSDLFQIGIPLAFFFKDERLIKAYPAPFMLKLFLLFLSGIISVLSIFGFAANIKRIINIFPIIIVILSNTLFYIVWFLIWKTGLTTRYGLPVVPYMILFAVSGIVFLANKLRGIPGEQ